MRSALEGMFANYQLSFDDDVTDMRSLVVEDEYATMIADFTLVGTPKTDKFETFTHSGVTVIVYIPDSNSPTGWSTLREMAIGK